MPWLHLTVTSDQAQATLVEDLFEALGALAVTYGDAATQPLLEPAPNEIRLWHSSRITALFADTVDSELLRAAVQANLPPDLAVTLELHTLEEQIWERAWLADFALKRFGRRLWICPAGQRPTQVDAVVIDLDPGLAFGTGAHATTALCLDWLDKADITGKRVLDYGCGSGILAIAAARLGALAVTAIDYDPQALEATHANARKNGVEGRLRILAPEFCPQQAYDYVIANILAGTLVNLAPQLALLSCSGGHLALSGILEHQVTWVISAYQEHFIFDPPLQSQEWVLLTGTRRDCCKC